MRPFGHRSRETPGPSVAQPEQRRLHRDGTAAPAGSAGWRSARRRSAVITLLGEADGFQEAKEIHAALRMGGERIALTTVYRVLQALADAGEVDVLRSPSGDSLYRLCGPDHHHNLMCRSCGRVVEFTGPTVELWVERVAAEYGYTDIGPSIGINGTCAECAATSAAGANGSS
jgi:Fur family transcriptional regulator, ferric uptake regulator